MDDNSIIALYNQRDEQAIAETDKKYGNYCLTIAFNVLNDRQDSEECVNDTYLKVWNVIPPTMPQRFKPSWEGSREILQSTDTVQRQGGSITKPI